MTLGQEGVGQTARSSEVLYWGLLDGGKGGCEGDS